MTAIQQQTIQLIRRLPDAKLQAIITLAADELSLMSFQQGAQNSNEKKTAFARLEELNLLLPSDVNADEELEKAIDEKYGTVD